MNPINFYFLSILFYFTLFHLCVIKYNITYESLFNKTGIVYNMDIEIHYYYFLNMMKNDKDSSDISKQK